MIKAVISALILLISLQLSAQLGTTPILGAKSLSMGNTGAAASGIQSIYFGQAGLSTIDEFAVEISTEQRFTLSDLTLASAALAFKAKNLGVLGLFISNYGLKEYREQKFGLSFSKQLAKSVAVGAQWSYNTIRIDEYGSTSFIGIDLGIIGYLNDKISIAAHISNPVTSVITTEESTTQIFNVGMKYNLSEKVSMLSDFRVISGYSNSFHFGLDYNIVKPLNFRIGVDTGGSSVHFGLSYNLNPKSAVQAGFTNHQYLGVTPALSLSYEK